MVYDPTLPVNIVSDKIGFVVDISELANRDTGDRKQVQLAYLIFDRTQKLQLHKHNQI